MASVQPRLHTPGDTNLFPGDWLLSKVREFEVGQERTLRIPAFPNGEPYRIACLQHDQKGVVATVLETLHQWLNCENLSEFCPLRMTVVCSDSSGKRAVIRTIKTLVALMRKMFGTNDVVRVAAPNGRAAYDAGGETLYHMLDIPVKSRQYWPGSMRQEKRLRLIQKFRTLLCLIVSERNLVSCADLGTIEGMIAETVHGGGSRSPKSFGGIPIVILFGDDYQLPGLNSGAFRALYAEGVRRADEVGCRVVLACAEHVVGLKGWSRKGIEPTGEAALLNRLRVGDKLTQGDSNKLLSLHISAIEKKHGKAPADEIRKKAVFLFLTNQQCARRNIICLGKTCDNTNPAVVLPTQRHGPINGNAVESHFPSGRGSWPQTSTICVNAKVALRSKNICPLWGLHIGACGVVKEIVFGKGCSPNRGDSPLYVVVDFPKYCGPPWDVSNPTVSSTSPLLDERMYHHQTYTRFLKFVPITTTEVTCRGKCCYQEHVPLGLAYAQTIHRFQGLSAGPVEDGEPPNVFDAIVCDPDASRYEAQFPGLFNTAVSSATTLGDDDGLNSALYFTGNHNLLEGRLNKPGKKLGNTRSPHDTYLKIHLRSEWVQHLRDNLLSSPLTRIEKENLFTWAEGHSISYSDLVQRVIAHQEVCPSKP